MTPTEEDLRLAEEFVEEHHLLKAYRRPLAAFRAEARREAEEMAEEKWDMGRRAERKALRERHRGRTVVGRASDGIETDWLECPICKVESPCPTALDAREAKR